MPNKVDTVFSGDARELFRIIELGEKRIDAFNQKINSFGVNPTFGNLATPTFKPIDTELAKANADVARYEKERLQREKLMFAEIERGEKALTRIKINEAKIANEAAIREIRERERAEKAAAKSSSGLGFGTGALVAGIAVGVGVDFLRDAKDAAFDAEKANRLLSSSATQAGLSYQFLTEKSQKFAKEGGLSDTAADKQVGLISRLAQKAGKPEDFDKIQTALLDTASARGLQIQQLETVISAVISGSSDEPLNAIGLADPGKLAADYAKSIGKITDALTPQEQVLSRLNPLLELAAVNAGANSERLASMSGQAEKASANIENLYTNFGNGLTQSAEFRNFLQFANDGLTLLIGNVIKAKKELADGTKTPKQLADEQRNTPLNVATALLGDIGSLITAPTAALFDYATGVDEKEIEAKFKATFLTSRKLQREALEKSFEADKKVVDRQNKDAGSEKNKLDTKTFASDFQSKIDSVLKGASDGVSKIKIQAKDIADARKLLNDNLNKFSDTDFEKAQKSIDTLTRKFYVERTEAADKRFSRNPNLEDAKFNLTALDSIKNKLPEDVYDGFKDKLDSYIEDAAEKVARIKDEFRDALVSENDNPFVKLFSDFDSVTDRARDKYKEISKIFGSTEIADRFADIDRAKTQKAINLKSFENNFDALKIRQEASRLAQAPERQFADFKRALETVERKTDALARIYSLDKQISEADFYARTFNPNNPKSFNESRFSFAERDRFSEIAGERKRGESLDDFEKRRKEAIDIGIKTFDAIKDVEKFKTFSLEGTGILGEGLIADKILDAIPRREDLLKQLESPYAQTRENAQFLLGEQSKALTVRRAVERKKHDDFLEDQKTAEFGKKFAYEQIGLINNDKSLTDAQKAQKRFSVAEALGNDLDPRLKSLKIQDAYKVAEEREKQVTEGREVAKDTRDLVAGLLDAILGGVKFTPETLTALQRSLQITVKDDTSSGASAETKPLKPSPTTKITETYYSEYQNQ